MPTRSTVPYLRQNPKNRLSVRKRNTDWIAYMSDLKKAVEEEYSEKISFGDLHRMVLCSVDTMTKYKNGERPFNISLLKIISLETGLDIRPWIDRGIEVGYWRSEHFYSDWKKRHK